MSNHNAHAHDPAKETRTYLITLVTLLILTVVTVGASYIDFGSGNVVIALAIATVKAIVVALFFMHLLYDKPVNALAAVAGFLFLGIFLLFILLDLGTRDGLEPQNLRPPEAAAPAAPAAAPKE